MKPLQSSLSFHRTADLPPRRGVVAVVVRDRHFLVIRRSQSVTAPGAYCFPGGAIEPGESERAALCRELLEELTVAVRPVRRLWQNITSRQVHLGWWLSELVSPGTYEPNAAEVASVHWMTVDEMLREPALLDSNRDFIAALRRGDFDLDTA